MDRETLREFARLDSWQRDHMHLHETEAQARRSERRWIISGVVIPTTAVLLTGVSIILTLLITNHP
jgi:hypothetical protein